MVRVVTVTLLETVQLRKSFGGLDAVAGVDFSVAKGEIRAIIGPNGAGKTTFVSMIAGRIKPDSGEIKFADQNIAGLAAHERVRRGIAYTFQITSIYKTLSVRENVLLAAHGAGNDRDCMARVGLADRAEQMAGTLAYGHQRLLEMAMGLALRPKLLILDEPTQGLSDPEIAKFIALVRELADEVTVLLIEHNMKVVMDVAHRITVLDQGRVLAEGSPDDIRKNVSVRNAYLGQANVEA